MANDPTVRAARNTRSSQRSRAGLIAMWITQIAVAAVFLMAGGSKLAGAPAMVAHFNAIGLGQWFRYVTGLVEVTAAIALLVPPTAFFGAMLLTATMLGAVAANLFIHRSLVASLVLLIAATAIGWARRQEVRNLIVLPR